MTWQEDYIIENWLEAIEMESYPEGTVMLFENTFLQKLECGFSYDQNKDLDKTVWNDVLEYRNYLSNYGNVRFFGVNWLIGLHH
jgi:hypothetical protein